MDTPMIIPIICQLCEMDWQHGACGDCTITRKQLNACIYQQEQIDLLTAQLDASRALLAERDAEITRLQQQSVGWVAVFDENAALREEVERYRGVNDGYGGKVLVPK